MGKVKRKDDFDRAVNQIIEARINAAVQVVRNRTVQLINRTQPTRLTAGGRLIGLDPSLPGEPPKRLTGALVRSIVAGVNRVGNQIVGFVGTNRRGARRLEFGFFGQDKLGRTINQPARPFLRTALIEMQPVIARILRAGGTTSTGLNVAAPSARAARKRKPVKHRKAVYPAKKPTKPKTMKQQTRDIKRRLASQKSKFAKQQKTTQKAKQRTAKKALAVKTVKTKRVKRNVFGKPKKPRKGK